MMINDDDNDDNDNDNNDGQFTAQAKVQANMRIMRNISNPALADPCGDRIRHVTDVTGIIVTNDHLIDTQPTQVHQRPAQ